MDERPSPALSIPFPSPFFPHLFFLLLLFPSPFSPLWSRGSSPASGASRPDAARWRGCAAWPQRQRHAGGRGQAAAAGPTRPRQRSHAGGRGGGATSRCGPAAETDVGPTAVAEAPAAGGGPAPAAIPRSSPLAGEAHEFLSFSDM